MMITPYKRFEKATVVSPFLSGSIQIKVREYFAVWRDEELFFFRFSLPGVRFDFQLLDTQMSHV